MTELAIADSHALYRMLDPKLSGHEAHRKALGAIGHLVISPLVLGELDHLISQRSGADNAVATLRFVERYAALKRFEIADVAPHVGTAVAVMRGYRDADQGCGVGLVT
ncbi:PIN domain-containing protein [Streptomyces sp. RKND-216]|uniref:PIN domain-containing protein n=1 Tax=Streptomyces sp. RKND-216 TaxID=2562581 RepID=UPI0032B5B7A3